MKNSSLGVLATIFTLQMNYFFGSTSGSKAKDDTIAAALPQNNPASMPDIEKVSVKTATGGVTINPK